MRELDQAQQVVACELTFKVKLGLDESTIGPLKLQSNLQKLWDVGGAAATGAGLAASSKVAGLFASGGWLSSIGLGASATTPVGWIVLAGVVTGGAYYGILGRLRKQSESAVITLPRYLNTPLDLLGASLFDQFAGLAIKASLFAGQFDQHQLERIVGYFVDEWGLDEQYCQGAIGVIESQVRDRKLKDMAEQLAKHQRAHPDCNEKVLLTQVTELLDEMLVGNDEYTEVARDIVLDQIKQALTRRALIKESLINLRANVVDQAKRLRRPLGH